jgi:hypothetical protein
MMRPTRSQAGHLTALLTVFLLVSLRPSWAGDRCPSKCFCVPISDQQNVAKVGRSERDLRALIHQAPEGAPVLLRDVHEVIAARRLSQDHLILLERTAASDANVASLGTAPRSTTILHNAPASIDEAETIHASRKGQIKNPHLAEIQASLKPLASIATDARTLHGPTIRASILERVRQADPDELIVLIAHQENGALRFSDASHVLPEELERPGGPTVWVLACSTLQQAGSVHGPVIGVGSRLTYAQALGLAARIHKAAAHGQSYHSILLSIQHSSPVVIGVVGTLIYLSFADDPEET